LALRYFEHRSTGVVVARLQGVETIREFISSTLGILLASSERLHHELADLCRVIVRLNLTPLKALVFALAMGLARGLFPASRAARLRIAEALRYA